MMEKDSTMMESSLTVIQRVAICFAAGVVGALAVVLFSHVLFGLGLSATLGVNAPVSLKSPDIYKPLFWGGLWGSPVRAVHKDGLEAPLPHRLFICPCSATRAVLVLFADERRGIFRVEPGAVVYRLSPVGKSALRDSYRFGCQGDHKDASVSVRDKSEKPPGIRIQLRKHVI